MPITKIATFIWVTAVFLMTFYIMIVVIRSIAEKIDRFYDRYIRRLGPERWLQFVTLPFYGAVVGGLISTGIAILVNPPPGNYRKTAYIAYALFAFAILLAVLAPVLLDPSSENPKKWIIALRIDRLKNGDWTHDTKADVIETVEKDRAAIIKKRDNKGIWFWCILALLIASDAAAFILGHTTDRKFALGQAIVIALILGGLAARRWVRPRYLRNALKYLDSYRAEADRLSPPSSTAPPSSATAVQHHDGHHDLWMAVGGLLLGAIIAQSGAVRRRSERR